MKRLVLLLLLLGIGSDLRVSAATGTATWPVQPTTPHPGYRAYVVTLVADGSGAVSGNAHSVLSGQVVSVRVDPGTGGSQPDDQFAVTVLDRGLDLLNGSGSGLSNAAPTSLQTAVVLDTVSPRLDITLANAGSGNTVTVTVLIHLSRDR